MNKFWTVLQAIALISIAGIIGYEFYERNYDETQITTVCYNHDNAEDLQTRKGYNQPLTELFQVRNDNQALEMDARNALIEMLQLQISIAEQSGDDVAMKEAQDKLAEVLAEIEPGE